MRELSGRASFGARAWLRMLVGGALAVLALIAGGCGNDTFTYGTPVITFSSVPGPFTSYITTIDSITLTRNDGTVVYALLTPQTVDFTKFIDITELVGTTALIEGTYTSAIITMDYTVARIYADIGGVSTALTVYDGNGTATNGVLPTATVISYTLKFDPSNPLVITHGVSVPLEFNFDLGAGAVLDTVNKAVTVHPVLTASAKPNPSKLLHARGLSVVADLTNNNFTINSRAFFDLASNPVGAVEIDVDANTAYNVNGITYQGPAGLAVINALPVNSIVEAYGTLGNLAAIKPGFIATQVYAGIAAQNYGTDHATGTVSAISGNTVTLRDVEVAVPDGNTVYTAVDVTLFDTLPMTVGSGTIVNIDGQPGLTNATPALLSVGQQVSAEGLLTTSTDSAGNVTFTGIDVTGANGTAGLVRLVSTPVYGSLNAGATATSAGVNLVSVGGLAPSSLVFTGTGSASGADADPTNYVVNNTSGVDLTTIPANTQVVRLDGLVTPFGTAPPDFNAAAVNASTDQVLSVDWINGGSTAPITVASDGITVNMSDANLGTSHTVQSGPGYLQTALTTVDLTSPLINPKIVPDPSLNLQFSVGNSTTTDGYTQFNSYAPFQTQLGTVLNGTNKLQKLVAVGKWDGTTFTAYRIDIVQLP
jgi:hypothetical protein